MADPISITAILTALYGGLQIVLDVMPELLREAHDANTKRRLTKLNALFLKAQIDEFTEEGMNYSLALRPPFSFFFRLIESFRRF